MSQVSMQRGCAGPRLQGGAMMLEALIAILIFSMGVLAIVGMQSVAVNSVSEAKYRTDASFLANQVVAEMWVNRTNLANYVWDGSGAAPNELANWLQQVNGLLPNSEKNPPNIAVDANNNVTVTLFWQRPEEAAAPNPPPPHQFVLTASINCC